MASAATAADDSMRLIALNETYSTWMTMDQINELAVADTGFMDITDYEKPVRVASLNADSRIPTAPSRQAQVNQVMPFACPSGDCTQVLWPINIRLASLFNRYYTTEDAEFATTFMQTQYSDAAGSRLGRDVSVELFEHSWRQPSLIVRVEGSTAPDEVVILGGHIDSIAGGAGSLAPGFDDDASGSATNFAVFKALMDADFRPERTLEFHAYAAEEVGLRGSGDIARDYARNNVDVVTMTQFDMTCYSPNKVVGLTADFTNRALTSFIGSLLEEYTGVRGGISICGYGCSDHAPFDREGYPAAFPFEAPFGQNNPFIHTTQDTPDKCDRDYMGEFTKLGVAYTVEMSFADTKN